MERGSCLPAQGEDLDGFAAKLLRLAAAWSSWTDGVLELAAEASNASEHRSRLRQKALLVTTCRGEESPASWPATTRSLALIYPVLGRLEELSKALGRRSGKVVAELAAAMKSAALLPSAYNPRGEGLHEHCFVHVQEEGALARLQEALGEVMVLAGAAVVLD